MCGGTIATCSVGVVVKRVGRWRAGSLDVIIWASTRETLTLLLVINKGVD